MIDLAFDLRTDQVRATTAATLLTHSDVRARVTFSSAPGDLTALQLALVTDATDPAVLAFTEDFALEDGARIWSALLDTSDTRLVEYMATKNAATLQIQVVAIIDGETRRAANVPVTVQKAAFTGPASGTGGPSYPTTGQMTTAISTAVAALQAWADARFAGLSIFAPLPGVTAYTGGTASCLDAVATTSRLPGAFVFFAVPGKGGQMFQLRTSSTPTNTTDYSVVRPLDYNASTNQKAWFSVF